VTQKATEPPKCHPNRPNHCNGLCRACAQHAYYLANKEDFTEANKEWRKNNKEKCKTSARKTTLWRLYRLTVEEWEKVNEFQKFVCAISGKPPGKTRLFTDHDHKTGLFRGLLSMRVNRGMAYFDDNPALLRAAADYLENPPAVSALGKKVFGLIGKAISKKKMVYGSETGPIVVKKRKRK
jgi:hypothetical protein